jgi:hypothetical protein
VSEPPDAKAQRNFPDPELPRRRTPNTGWEYCGPAPARVDAAWQSIVACDVTDAPNDTQQAAPLAQATRAPLAQAGMERPKDESGDAQAIPAPWEKGDDRAAAGEARES